MFLTIIIVSGIVNGIIYNYTSVDSTTIIEDREFILQLLEWIVDDSATHHIKTNYNPNEIKHNDYLFNDLSRTKNNFDSEFKRVLDTVTNW